MTTHDDEREDAHESDPRPAREEESEDLPRPNEILSTLFEDQTLWPLLTVLLISLGALFAALLVLALGDRNPFAALALLLIAGMTIDVVIRARSRPSHRALAKALGLLWLVAIALAGIAVYSGIA